MELEEGMKLGMLEKAEQVDAQEESISKALVSAVASSKISRENRIVLNNLTCNWNTCLQNRSFN